jgi:hypothetical protein
VWTDESGTRYFEKDDIVVPEGYMRPIPRPAFLKNQSVLYVQPQAAKIISVNHHGLEKPTYMIEFRDGRTREVLEASLRYNN